MISGKPNRSGRNYSFKPPDKRRPVLILTRNSAISFLNEVTIAPVTSNIRDIPSEIVIGPEDGMPYRCAVNFDHIQTVAKDRLGELITTLSDDKMAEAGVAICFALGIEI
ncbi:Toxin MazF5 [Moorella humiferrea]|uniref:Toxin MazF5 n=1 Tax=Neomoorella humiferrea TaxID=676965 RepID=A0A2T0ARK5_9FIRM|nr:Toxin MazF5 [Moorella humiferrea]